MEKKNEQLGMVSEEAELRKKLTQSLGFRRDPSEIRETVRKFGELLEKKEGAVLKTNRRTLSERNQIWKPLSLSETRKMKRESLKEIPEWSLYSYPFL